MTVVGESTLNSEVPKEILDLPHYYLSMRPHRLIVFPDGRRFVITPIDIASTSKADARTIFEKYKADGVILEAFMGADCLEPFLKYGKPVWVMVRAWPNKDAPSDLITEDGRAIWQVIASLIQECPQTN